MRSSHIVTSAVGGLLVLLYACSPAGSSATSDGADAGDGTLADDAAASKDAGTSRDARSTTPPRDSGGPVIGPGGNDHCAAATSIPLSAANPRVDLAATTVGASHDVDVPCASGAGADVFYKFAFSKRVFVYADTFGATWDTSLFLLDDTCTPLTASTTAGDAVCSDDACGKPQSQIVAVLEPGTYRLGLSGRGQGAATIHFEWALAGGGAIAQLPQGSTVQHGTTSGEGNIDGISSDCLAAGPENSYWWARCPSDPGGTLTASTCGGTTWESIVEVQIPKSVQYQCNLDGCGLQATMSTLVPAGAGLGVLSVDGQSGTDVGEYALTVSRP
jgi:hypothetical protein